jgi:PAS domain S-box-containing protein
MRDEDGNIIGALCIFDDVTYLKNKEEKLRQQEKELRIKLEQVEESEFFLKEMAKAAKIGGWEINTIANEIVWSDEVYNIHGVPIGQLPSLEEALDFFIEGDKEVLTKAINESVKYKKPYDLQLRFQNKKKEKLWVRTIGYPTLNDENETLGLKGVFQDITDIRQMRDELEQQQNMYDLLANNIIDILSIFELDGTFRYVTPSIKKILGYEQSDMDERKFYEFVHPEDKPGLKEFLGNDVLIHASEKTYDVRVINKSGDYKWLEIISSLIYKNGELDCVVASARDITKAVLDNKKLARYQNALKKLTNEIVNVEEKAKRRIASNIHDHLSQALVMARIMIDKLLKQPDARNEKNLFFVKTHIINAIDNSRKITTELSPQVLYQLGLIEALHWLIENYQDTYPIRFELETILVKVKLTDSQAIILYRCVQELLNNAIKHSEASKIMVKVDRNESQVFIHVVDDGIGFEPTKLDAIYNYANGGYGLLSIRERLENVGGEFVIQSRPNEGSNMKIIMPIS